MLNVSNVTLRFGSRLLFEDVNIKFTEGNCYGLIGANGAGKTTFLKILSGEIEANTGDISLGNNERMSVLKQDQFAYDDYTVLATVVMGNTELYKIMQEKDRLYSKPDFSDEDGIKVGKLEDKFANLNGWMAETDAAILLNGLGVGSEFHERQMKDLESKDKVKVLLAQALFGNPDVLLLDEPTNNLDINAITWLEEFLADFPNTVIVVSHDRHFINNVCTHIADLDFNKITVYAGNYDFWYESSQLVQKQMKDSNKKKEEKIKELQDFIARFSANASKSKQATSRKKSLEKIELDEIKPTSRKYPYVDFKFEKPIGRDVLAVKGLSKQVDDKVVLKDIYFNVNKDDKIAVMGSDLGISTFFDILAKETKQDKGTVEFGSTVTTSYFAKDNSKYFLSENNLVEWLRDYSKEKDESFLRGFLGRMLFSGEEALKKVNVLSGGEKVRCMLSKMMLSDANFIILNDPTNHLDLESITALNNGLINFKGNIIFSSHDHQFLQTVANRIIVLNEDGTIIDKDMTYDEYLESTKKSK